MKIDKQLQIAKSFSNFFEESILDINLEKKEYEILKQGIFSSDMDDKWNVFIIENFLYLSRSWTDNRRLTLP